MNVVNMLSDELWFKILSYLYPGDRHETHFWSLAILAKDQREFYLLRRVCSKFNQLFLDYPMLSRCLVLEWRQPSRPVHAPGLLAWLRRFSCSVKHLKLKGGAAAVHMVFGALVTQPQHLRSLELGKVDRSDLQLASLFTSLTRLALSESNPHYSFKINALQAMPYLQEIWLHVGEFCIPRLPSGLLALQLEEAHLQLTNSANCIAPLKQLRMRHSHFTTYDSRGLLAYTTLEELHLHYGSISGDYASNSARFGAFRNRPFSCPDLSPLKCLMTLYVEVGGSMIDSVIDWRCLYCLPALQALTLHSTAQDLEVTENLTMLGTLTSLRLIGAACPVTHMSIVVYVAIDVDWCAMPYLQSLYIESDVLSLGPQLSSLIAAPALRYVNIVDSRRVSAQAPYRLAALVSSTVVQRPDVTFVLNGKRMLVKDVV